MPHRSSARLLAPAALVAAAIAVYVIATSGKGNGSPSGRSAPAATVPSARRQQRKPKTYVVKAGDVLSVIAVQTGISIEKLQRLNPGVDAQSLRPGQKLKLPQ
jgi:LysM repeat protein